MSPAYVEVHEAEAVQKARRAAGGGTLRVVSTDAAPLSATSRAYAAATEALAAADPVIRRLAAETGPVRIPRSRDSHFGALVQAIVHQQLAEPVARVLHGRLVDALGGDVRPERVAAMSDAEMRTAGMSGAKIRSLHDLAGKVLDGTLDLTPRRLARRSDAEIVERLISVRGIGLWSAQMFLIFQLRRLDVWPAGDLGVRRGYGIGWNRPMPTAKELEPVGEPYRPYRTVLAWYCWKADASRVH
jgi:DNA-3-methyladenine glycosylase II